MPNFDAGSYFLTVLAPVKSGAVPAQVSERQNSWDSRFRSAIKNELEANDTSQSGDAPVSWRQRLRMVLATLPTASQSPATERMQQESPFARNRRNHLTRFVVIDDVVYNGRLGQKPIVMGRSEPLVPQHVDKLASPYLLFVADIDATTLEGAPLPAELSEREQADVRDSYLRDLWTTAPEEMRAVFENCQGFEDINSADDFAAYIAKCQIETTMPFHDYWIEPPALKVLPIKLLVLIAALPLLLLAVGLVWSFGGAFLNVFVEPNWNLDTPFWMAAVGLIASAVTLFAIFKYVLRFGSNPFAPPKHGDLPSVLKSLYLQQKFSDFVITNQPADAQALHERFGAFLKEHQPANKDAPSQKPGVISSSAHGAVRT